MHSANCKHILLSKIRLWGPAWYLMTCYHICTCFFQARKTPRGNQKGKHTNKQWTLPVCTSSCVVLTGISPLHPRWYFWSAVTTTELLSFYQTPRIQDCSMFQALLKEYTWALLQDDMPCLVLRSRSNTEGKLPPEIFQLPVIKVGK